MDSKSLVADEPPKSTPLRYQLYTLAAVRRALHPEYVCNLNGHPLPVAAYVGCESLGDNEIRRKRSIQHPI